MDQEAMYYLYRIYREMPWIALEIEKHPDTPRVSSMRTWNLVAYHAKLFRLRYNPMNYKEPARAKIEVLLRLLDEIAPYYSIEQKPPGSGS